MNNLWKACTRGYYTRPANQGGGTVQKDRTFLVEAVDVDDARNVGCMTAQERGHTDANLYAVQVLWVEPAKLPVELAAEEARR